MRDFRTPSCEWPAEENQRICWAPSLLLTAAETIASNRYRDDAGGHLDAPAWFPTGSHRAVSPGQLTIIMAGTHRPGD